MEIDKKLLQRLIASGPFFGDDQGSYCLYCDGEAGVREEPTHVPDCPWVQAKALFDPEVMFDKNYGQDTPCLCGHPYYRHFDWMEDDAAVGCKYCGDDFVAAGPEVKAEWQQ